MDSRLLNSCIGKSESSGGLNLPEMKKELIKLYPEYKEEIQQKTRKSLYSFCKKNFGKDIQKAKKKYFVHDAHLNERQMAYCRCIPKVAVKNPEWCYKHEAWKKNKEKCVNPYAVCTKSTGRKGRFYCGKYYDFDNIPEKEVEALAALKGVSVNEMKRQAAKERRDYFEKVNY